LRLQFQSVDDAVVTPETTPEQPAGTDRPDPDQRSDESSHPSLPLSDRKSRRGIRTASILVAVLAAAGFVVLLPYLAQTFHPVWPAAPEIHPISSEAGPSFTPQFIVRNPNGMYDLAPAQFWCGVDLVYFDDADYKTALVRDVAFLTGTYSIKANGGQIKYDCDASGLLQTQPDGFIAFRDPLATSHIEFREPLRIHKMCLWIGGIYNVWGHNVSFTSKIFQWPVRPSVNEWAERPVLRDPREKAASPEWPPSAAWALRSLYTQFFPRKLLPDALECSDSVKFPYLLFRGSEKPILIGKG
jgi:hypothetical protein